MKLINYKKFTTAILALDTKTFIIHIEALDIKSTKIAVYFSWAAQIKLLKTKDALTTIFNKYSDYTDIILPEFAA